LEQWERFVQVQARVRVRLLMWAQVKLKESWRQEQRSLWARQFE
jgi:hypothetical protein